MGTKKKELKQVKCYKCNQRLFDVMVNGTIVAKCSRCGCMVRIRLCLDESRPILVEQF